MFSYRKTQDMTIQYMDNFQPLLIDNLYSFTPFVQKNFIAFFPLFLYSVIED